MIRIKVTGAYSSMLDDLLQDNPNIQSWVDESVEQFQNSPDDTRLANHPLHKKMEGKWAFSVTDDIRIVYEWVGKSSVRFLAIGSHTPVYPKSS